MPLGGAVAEGVGADAGNKLQLHAHVVLHV
jgi:hypothetical protein